MGTIRLATTIRAPAERCFDLARSVSAHVASMRTTQERVVTSIASDLLGPGAVITWEAMHFGARIRLMSKITQYDAPRSFEDEQIAGPFESFWHRHEFSANRAVTVMTDLVRYRSPFGFLGTLAERVFLDRYLRVLLERRAAHLRELAEFGA